MADVKLYRTTLVLLIRMTKDVDGPSPELLDFPCQFQIKAMGRKVDGFQQRVSEIVLRHLNDAPILDKSIRESSSSRYVSVSCTIQATSREQLDAIYMDLNSEQDVLMTL